LYINVLSIYIQIRQLQNPGYMSNKRSRARSRAVQAIYQWQMTGQDIVDIKNHFIAEHPMTRVDVSYFQELACKVVEQVYALDDDIVPFLDRDLQAVDPVERAILRLGTYELAQRPDIPYRVIINESVELAKSFGGEAGHKYVNSILDKIALKLRGIEIAARDKN